MALARAADQLLVTPLLADKLQTAAEDIAAQLTSSALLPVCRRPRLLAWRPSLPHWVPRSFAVRPAQRARTLCGLRKAAPTPLEGGKRLLAAMLQSPRFLYRTELGTLDAESGLYVLGDYEVASELSYLLWQTAPDQALLDAAKKGELHGEQQMENAVERMLEDRRARPVLTAFVKDWLGLSAIMTVPKDTGSFPELTTEIRAALSREVDRFVDHVLFTGMARSRRS